VKNISFDGRHAIPFSLLTDAEKADLLRTVRTFQELPNGSFIAEYSDLCVRLESWQVDSHRISKSLSDLTSSTHQVNQPQALRDSTTSGSKRRQLSKNAPGSIALKIVNFLCNRKTVEKTFRPLVADWRAEYLEALSESRRI
jgi:hypothetical protein